MSTASPPPKVACPHCQALIKAPALAAGSLVNCPKCGKGFRLGERQEERQEKPGARGQEPGGGGRGAGGEPRTKAMGQPRKVADQAGQVASTAPGTPAPTELAAASKPKFDPRTAGPSSKRPKQPDYLVDPNMLAPPPPVVQPKPKEVAVVCSLCRSRLYAPLEKIGQTIKCPDCHTVNEVMAPVEPKEKKATGPTLEDAEEYAMSDPGERPAYRPLQAARGEYEILSALDPSAVAHGWKLPDADAKPPGGDDEEFQLEAPVERVSLASEPIKRPVLEEPDPEDKLRDGRYDDALIGENVDRREAEAWKKSPFLIGVFEFLIQPETLGRLASYAFGLAVVLILGSYTVQLATTPDRLSQSIAVFFSAASAACLGLWMMPFAATVLAIVQDTGNGSKEVDNWPSWDPTQWFFPALYVAAAVLVSGLPGMFLTTGLFASTISSGGWASGLFMAGLLSVPLPLSWLVLLPIVLYSMLAENSIFAIFSRQTLASLRAAGEGWMLFYMCAAVLFLIAGAVGSLIFLNNFLAIGAGAVGLVILAFLYARLLGRLMWYGNQQVAKAESEGAN